VVRHELAALLANIGDDHQALNIGSGESDLHSGVTNLDVDPSDHTDCVGDALMLPFEGDTFQLVISQETMEHVTDPFQAVREMGWTAYFTFRCHLYWAIIPIRKTIGASRILVCED
jgi:hypothetical protein